MVTSSNLYRTAERRWESAVNISGPQDIDRFRAGIAIPKLPEPINSTVNRIPSVGVRARPPLRRGLAGPEGELIFRLTVTNTVALFSMLRSTAMLTLI